MGSETPLESLKTSGGDGAKLGSGFFSVKTLKWIGAG
jgi:hypothetical protein